jgi:hypothetical protein
LIENVGNLPVPIDLTLTLEDGSQTKLLASTSIGKMEIKKFG